VEGTGWLEQYLIEQGIIQNKTVGFGILTSAELQGKNTKFRAGYIGLKGRSMSREGRECRYKTKKTITNGNN
jgi:hypothetical protein